MPRLIDGSESESAMINTRNQARRVNIHESGSSYGVIVFPNEEDANNDDIDAGGMCCVVASHDEIIEIMAKRGTWKQTFLRTPSMSDLDIWNFEFVDQETTSLSQNVELFWNL